jgi:hypothetical protein
MKHQIGVIKPLSAAERKHLANCETRLKVALTQLKASTLKAAQVLWEIKDYQLYRDYTSFGNYVEDRVQISRVFAERLASAGRTLKLLANIQGQKPSSESQLRPIVALLPNAIAQVWTRSQEIAGAYPITAQMVVQAKAEVLGLPAPQNHRRERSRIKNATIEAGLSFEEEQARVWELFLEPKPEELQKDWATKMVAYLKDRYGL